MDIIELAQQLIKSRLMQTVEEFEDFEDALYKILNLKDINHIPILCKTFDDETECPEVMFNLIHGIESYIDVFSFKEYLQKLIIFIPIILSNAKDWLKEINIRIILHKEGFQLYKQLLKESNKSIQNMVIENLNQIKLDYSYKHRFDKKIDEIILYINNNNN